MKVLSIGKQNRTTAFGITPKDKKFQDAAKLFKTKLGKLAKEADGMDLTELTETPAEEYARRLEILIKLGNRLGIDFFGARRVSA